MTQKKITITIDKLGTAKVEAHCFEGSDCATATAPIERALGGGGQKALKDAYYAAGDNRTQEHERW
jgi:hypothetical protein